MSVIFNLKKKIIWIIAIVGIGIVFVFLMGIVSLVAGVSNTQQQLIQAATGLSEDVEQYRTVVEQIADQYGISEYTNHLLCLMQEETSGLGTDVMNAGNFQSNKRYEKKRGGILNPNYSIECGVSEFRDLLQLANVTDENNTDKLLIVYQSYHTDRGFVDYALHNGGFSKENAQAYLTEQAYPEYISGAFAEKVNFWYQLISAGTGEFIYPLTSTVISSPFGNRSGEYGGFHGGIDFPAPIGTPVYASADGIVVLARVNGTYGNCVMVKHSATYTTLYAHNSAFNVHEGDHVSQGDIIAFVGNTGRSSGPHCHFEIRVNGERVDPILFLPKN